MRAYGSYNGRNFGRYNGRNISAILSSFGVTAETEFSAVRSTFGQKYLLRCSHKDDGKPMAGKWSLYSLYNICLAWNIGTLCCDSTLWPIWLVFHLPFLLSETTFNGQKFVFRSKTALTAENNCYLLFIIRREWPLSIWVIPWQMFLSLSKTRRYYFFALSTRIRGNWRAHDTKATFPQLPLRNYSNTNSHTLKIDLKFDHRKRIRLAFGRWGNKSHIAKKPNYCGHVKIGYS